MIGRAREWMNRWVRVKDVIPMYLVLSVSIGVAIWQVNLLGEQRTTDTLEIIELLERESCLRRIDTRESLRDVFGSLFDLFPGEPVVESLRDTLDDQYPPLDPESECP